MQTFDEWCHDQSKRGWIFRELVDPLHARFVKRDYSSSKILELPALVVKGPSVGWMGNCHECNGHTDYEFVPVIIAELEQALAQVKDNA